MMYLILFVGLVLFMLNDLCKTKVDVKEEVDGITIEISNFTNGVINIELDY